MSTNKMTDCIMDYLDALQEITSRTEINQMLLDGFRQFTRFERYEKCRELALEFIQTYDGTSDFDESITRFLKEKDWVKNPNPNQWGWEHFAVVVKNPDNTAEVISVCDDTLGNLESEFDRVNHIIKEDNCVVLGVFKSTNDADNFIDAEKLARPY